MPWRAGSAQVQGAWACEVRGGLVTRGQARVAIAHLCSRTRRLASLLDQGPRCRRPRAREPQLPWAWWCAKERCRRRTCRDARRVAARGAEPNVKALVPRGKGLAAGDAAGHPGQGRVQDALGREQRGGRGGGLRQACWPWGRGEPAWRRGSPLLAASAHAVSPAPAPALVHPPRPPTVHEKRHVGRARPRDALHAQHVAVLCQDVVGLEGVAWGPGWGGTQQVRGERAESPWGAGQHCTGSQGLRVATRLRAALGFPAAPLPALASRPAPITRALTCHADNVCGG
jgi:hypothetical protein